MRKIIIIAGLLTLAGCPQQQDVSLSEALQHARLRVDDAATAGEISRTILEVLGLLPDYTCGEPQSLFVDDVVNVVQLEYPCATLSTHSVTDAIDAIIVSFPPEGCEFREHTLAGILPIFVNGGDDRVDVDVDLSDFEIDGVRVDARAGYGQCGDETTYSVAVSGVLPVTPERNFHIDASVATRDGIPIIGGSTIILDGTATIEGPIGDDGGDAAADQVRLQELEYELGKLLPQAGTIIVETASGQVIRATFDRDSPLHGTVTIAIDDGDPVTIPLP